MFNKFSNLILNWGVVANNTAKSYNVALSLAFSENKYVVIATDWASPTNSPYVIPPGIAYHTLSTTHFTVHYQNNSPRGFGYIAIGF